MTKEEMEKAVGIVKECLARNPGVSHIFDFRPTMEPPRTKTLKETIEWLKWINSGAITDYEI